MGHLSERATRIMTGLITVTFLGAAVVFGVKAATGSLDAVYHVKGTFTAAGQGLIRDSDVKIRGVNVGRVTKVRLRNGRAVVTMEIHRGEKIPTDAKATIRPKTLFGEKFVDIDPGEKEAHGPYLANNDTIKHTLGGFELERVLAEAYPILKAVDPAELAVVLDTLAGGARGEGDVINRQIANWQKVSDINVAHDAETRQFLDDLAKLSDTLANHADDVVAGARDLNVALPVINDRAAELTGFLEDASRLSADLADVLEANRGFLNKNVTEGGKTIQVLSDNRGQIPGLVLGLRQFFQVLGEATGRTDLTQPDGTRLAAIKLIFGGGSPCGRTTEGCPAGGSSTASAAGGPTAPAVPGVAVPRLPVPGLPVPQLPVPTTGAAGLEQLLGRLLG